MSRTHILFAWAFLVLSCSIGHAETPPSSEEILESAIAAHGGEKELSRLQVCQTYFAGKEGDITFTGEVWQDGESKQRVETQAIVAGQKVRSLRVLTDDRGWSKNEGFATNGVEELTGDDLARAREYAYITWLTTLTPLRGSQFTLGNCTEAKVKDRPAYAITVLCTNKPDVQLFFDQETCLLVKLERSINGSDGEVKEETFYHDHEEQGLRQARKITITGNAKLVGELEITGYAPKDSAGMRLFEMP